MKARWLVPALAVAVAASVIAALTSRTDAPRNPVASRPVQATPAAAAPLATEVAEAVAPYYPPAAGTGWTRIGVTAAHAVMVVQLELEVGASARTAAEEIVEAVGPNYGEILIYLHAAGQESSMPTGRIQWTPGRGYVETPFDMPGDPDRE